MGLTITISVEVVRTVGGGGPVVSVAPPTFALLSEDSTDVSEPRGVSKASASKSEVVMVTNKVFPFDRATREKIRRTYVIRDCPADAKAVLPVESEDNERLERKGQLNNETMGPNPSTLAEWTKQTRQAIKSEFMKGRFYPTVSTRQSTLPEWILASYFLIRY